MSRTKVKISGVHEIKNKSALRLLRISVISKVIIITAHTAIPMNTFGSDAVKSALLWQLYLLQSSAPF